MSCLLILLTEVLGPPIILQDPNPATLFVNLNCIVKTGEASSILWLIKGEPLGNKSMYHLSQDNRTLRIDTENHEACQQYTCVIRNQVSENRNSRLLILEGLLLLHEFSLVASTIAVVSSTTSYAAAIFILFFALDTYRVHKRHVQLTAAFVFSQITAFISVLIASLLCLLDPAFSIAYKIIEGIGFAFLAAMIVYLLFQYLQPETQLKSSFLMKKVHRNFFLVYGFLAVAISIIPVYRGQYSIHLCQLPSSHISGTIALSVVIYVFILGMGFITFLRYMRSWTKVRRLSHLSLR
ncbi:uncharacterized protein LOC119976437 [Scyliorhinus canicula]|uniref:uncharacterized protein LOC119976437 n=1 Tax=Scyliorhinus canicula TaxID=7830 RepID=UPI0018F487D9|nr:uncharacterized protein LOC119976437 [Scyliorhinus canicula]